MNTIKARRKKIVADKRSIMMNERPKYSSGFNRKSKELILVCMLLSLLSTAATIYFCRTMGGGMPMPGGWTMSMMWMAMPGQTWLFAALSFMAMWTGMMMAMMIPSLIPMLWQYRMNVDSSSQHRIGRLTWIVGIGYFFVWTAIGFVCYVVGVALSAFEMQHPILSRTVPLLGGITIVIAGALQFTQFKARQLTCCRQTSDGRNLSANTGAAWRHGLRLGRQCCRCCFSLMLILVVAGMMNLAVMFLVTAAITVERILPTGRRFALINGICAMLAGVFLILQWAGI